MGKSLSKKDLAQLLGKSERWITRLIDEGLPVAGGGGRGVPVEIDSEAAIDWLIQREMRRQYGEDDDEGDLGSAEDEDRRLKKARREKLMLEIEQMRGRLLPLEGVEAILARVASVFATQLDAIASRLAADMAVINDPAEARHRILTETRRVRAATADGLVSAAQRLARETRHLDRGDGQTGDGTATEDGG